MPTQTSSAGRSPVATPTSTGHQRGAHRRRPGRPRPSGRRRGRGRGTPCRSRCRRPASSAQREVGARSGRRRRPAASQRSHARRRRGLARPRRPPRPTYDWTAGRRRSRRGRRRRAASRARGGPPSQVATDADDPGGGGQEAGRELDQDAERPTALSAARVEGQARRRADAAAARRGRRRARSRGTGPTTGMTKKPTMPSRAPDHWVRAGTPAALRPAAGHERTSPRCRRRGSVATTAKTIQPVGAADLDGPDQHGAEDQDRAGQHRHHDADQADERSARPTRTSAALTASACHSGRRTSAETHERPRTAGPGPSWNVWWVVRSALAVGRRPGRRRACGSRRGRSTAISRSLSPCSRAWWAQKSSSPPAGAPRGGRPGHRSGRSGPRRSAAGWGQLQWSRRPLSLPRCLAQRSGGAQRFPSRPCHRTHHPITPTLPAAGGVPPVRPGDLSHTVVRLPVCTVHPVANPQD